MSKYKIPPRTQTAMLKLNSTMIAINRCISIMTLHIHGLSSPIKRHRLRGCGFSSVVECLPSKHKALDLVLSFGAWGGRRGRHRLNEWIRKQNSSLCCLQEIHLSFKNRYFLRVKGWTKVHQLNETREQAGVVLLIPDKIDFKLKLIRSDRETSYSNQGIIDQEGFSILNMYALNSGASNFIKNVLLDLNTQI